MNDSRAWRSLVRKREFQKVYEQGVKKVGRLVVVYLLPADDTARAVVASKKVGGAVQRNRAKRLLREALRLGELGRPEGVGGLLERLAHGPQLGGPDAGDAASSEGLWVVLVARQAILKADIRSVRRELDALLADEEGPRGTQQRPPPQPPPPPP